MSKQALVKGKAVNAPSSASLLTGQREQERAGKASEGSKRISKLWTPDHDFGRLSVHDGGSPVIQPKLKMSVPGG
jgi:hypothetical protein